MDAMVYKIDTKNPSMDPWSKQGGKYDGIVGGCRLVRRTAECRRIISWIVDNAHHQARSGTPMGGAALPVPARHGRMR